MYSWLNASSPWVYGRGFVDVREYSIGSHFRSDTEESMESVSRQNESSPRIFRSALVLSVTTIFLACGVDQDTWKQLRKASKYCTTGQPRIWPTLPNFSCKVGDRVRWKKYWMLLVFFLPSFFLNPVNQHERKWKRSERRRSDVPKGEMSYQSKPGERRLIYTRTFIKIA